MGQSTYFTLEKIVFFLFQTKEMNIAQLVEEINALRVEKVQSETKMSAEIKQLQQEVKMEQQAHAMEVGSNFQDFKRFIENTA